MQDSERKFYYEIRERDEGVRLDLFLATCRPVGLTRSRINALIKDGNVRVNNLVSKPSYRLKPGDKIACTILPAQDPVLEPEEVGFGIIHEDSSLIIVNKPAGVVVHPSPGHARGTLVHGLLRHCRDLSGIGGELRPGIVHRLDKDTSGLMVVAKNDRAHHLLAKQFKSGGVKKDYLALVHGRVKEARGRIDLPLGRHPTKRKKMAVASASGKTALTLWEKKEEFLGGFTLLSVSLKTGRTHQIRVHLSHMGHPILGDSVYGPGPNALKRHSLYQKGVLPLVDRQMLHSASLGFIHPHLNTYVQFESPLPEDMKHVLSALKRLNLQAQ